MIVLVILDRAAAEHEVLAAPRTDNASISWHVAARGARHRLRDRVIVADSRFAASALGAFPALELHLETSHVTVSDSLRRIRLLFEQFLAMVNVQVPFEALRSSTIVRLSRLVLRLLIARSVTWIAKVGDGDYRIRHFLFRYGRLTVLARHPRTLR